jgi:membrane protease YdiL (CAAX protease family)
VNLLALGSPVPGALGSWLDARLASGLVFALPFGLAGLALLRFGLLPRLGDSFPPGRDRAGRASLTGFTAAFALLLASVVPPALLGAFRPGASGYAPFVPVPGPAALSSAPFTFGFLALLSLEEELLFRAFFFTLLAALALSLGRLLFGSLARLDGPARARRAGRRWLAAGLIADAVQSLGFALLHAGNPNVTPLALLNIGLAGAVLGWLYWGEGGLFGCWTFHALWNSALAALALPVSGMAFGPPLLPAGIAGAGLPLLSGGAFGPEGSLLNTVGLATVLALLVRRSARRLPVAYAEPR